MTEIRVIVADDEPLVRRGLRELLAAAVDATLVGEARNGIEAVALIRSARPDIAFLDIQMPGRDGFEVLAELTSQNTHPLPVIVFVTAHDAYALRAFDVHAVDYLLKPFDDARFQTALSRARARLGEVQRTALDGRVAAVLAELRNREQHDDRLLVKQEGRIIVVATDDIEWIEAQDNYVRIHAAAQRYMLREPLKSVAQRLDPRRFAQVHRSALVNLRRVRELQPMFGGEYVVIMANGTKLTLSRHFRDQFREQLSGHPVAE